MSATKAPKLTHSPPPDYAVVDAHGLDCVKALHRHDDLILVSSPSATGTMPVMLGQRPGKVGDIMTVHDQWMRGVNRYMSVNGYTTTPSNPKFNPKPKLAGGVDLLPQAITSNVSRLTSVFVDIDTGLAKDTAAVIPKVWEDVKQRTLPVPSMFLHSGRGRWVMWFLHNDQGHASEAGKDIAPTLWQAIEQAAVNAVRQAMGGLGVEVDAQVKNPSRWCRLPSSCRNDGTVVYGSIVYDSDGTQVTYTPADLAKAFDVNTGQAVEASSTIVGFSSPAETHGWADAREFTDASDAKRKAGKDNGAKRWQYDIKRLWRLVKHRGKLTKPHRRASLKLLALFHCCRGDSTDVAREQALLLVDYHHPKLDTDMVEQAIVEGIAWRSQQHHHNVSHNTIADYLGITKDEHRTMSRLFMDDDLGIEPWPYIGMPATPKGPAKAEQVEQRRARLATLLQSNPTYSNKALADMLEVSSKTIQRDRQAIGLKATARLS